MDPDAGGLGAGASLSALLLGRDDAEYYRRTGALLTLLAPPRRAPCRTSCGSPPSGSARWRRGPIISLPGVIGDRELGPVAAADPADQLGARVQLQRTLGEDPARPRLHGSTRLEGWAGTFDYGRVAADVQLAVPLRERRRTAALEVAGGSALGDGARAGALAAGRRPHPPRPPGERRHR
jgi:hypothetical protein